jgi:hypothetical protein
MNDDPARRRTARAAGVLLLLSLILPLCTWEFLLQPLLVADDPTAIAGNMVAHELRLRMAVVSEIIMAACAFGLGLTFFALVEHVDRRCARLALSWKAAEAGLVAVIALVTLTAMNLVDASAAASTTAVPALMGLFLGVHQASWAVAMAFLGLGTALFFSLFYRARAIPRALAALGVVAYLCVLVQSFLVVLAPDVAAATVTQVVLYAPSFVAEIVIGTWLVVRGVSVNGGAA